MNEQASTGGSIEHAIKLKFDNKHIPQILSGEKTVTLRVGMGSDEFREGDPIMFCDEEGDFFAEAEVKDRSYTTVAMAARMDWDGHTDYDSADQLLDQLQGYYPDEDISPDTRLEIIEWGKLW